MAKVGGLKESQPITDDARNIALNSKSEIESKAGRTFSTFKPVEFSTQVVAGTNFFIKIDVGGEHIVARIFRDLKNNVSVNSVKTGLGASDPIQYF